MSECAVVHLPCIIAAPVHIEELNPSDSQTVVMTTKPLKFLALHLEVILTKSHGTKMVNRWMARIISGSGELEQWKEILSMGKHKLWRVFLRDSRKVSYELSGVFFQASLFSFTSHCYVTVCNPVATSSSNTSCKLIFY